MANVAASALLPVLIDEIRRLKELHALTSGLITELPVKDVACAELLAGLRADFAELKEFVAGNVTFPASPAPTSGSSGSEAVEVAEDPQQVFGSAQEHPRPPASRSILRPRLPSVDISGILPLPDGCNSHFFLSHFQATGSDQVATLELELKQLGLMSWYDNKAMDLTKAGMREGVAKTGCFLLFLSRGVMARPYVQYELRTAIELGKKIVLVHETESVHGRFEFAAEKATAPADLAKVLDDHESIAYRRRDHEREAMLQKVVSISGYKRLLDQAKEQASTLAPIPPEVMHWGHVEGLMKREAHDAVKRALLSDSSSQCVVAHGMGGTGKTICAMIICKDIDIRKAFAKLAWVSIGQEAAIKELQETMMLQITGQAMPQSESAETEEDQGRLRLLQDAALETEGRLLVVLDDPWLPEQVNFLNPLDPASSSKMLVTTRIRSLVKQAIEVPLQLLKIEESAAMLMEIGDVHEAEYRAQHPGQDFPPPAALRIASECGNLPLTVTLAGKMIKSWGSLWADIDGGRGVLAVLQKDNKKYWRRSAGGATNTTKQFSNTLGEQIGSTLEQRIISAGLNSIRGSEAEYVKDLFLSLAVTVEDLMHDSSVVELIWTSCGDPTLIESVATDEVPLKVRAWIGELLSRSLLLGNAAAIHVHDIMLGFLRARLDKKTMLTQQRRAVRGVLRWCEGQETVKVTGRSNKAASGEHLDWYVNRALHHHMQHALDLEHLSLTEDAEAQQWCQHDELLVLRAVLQAAGKEEVVRIMHWFTEVKGEHYQPVRMAYAIGSSAAELLSQDERPV
eukprot:g185.t1